MFTESLREAVPRPSEAELTDCSAEKSLEDLSLSIFRVSSAIVEMQTWRTHPAS
jgi:hypothetical protein